MSLKSLFVKSSNILKIFIIVVLVFVIGGVVSLFKNSSGSKLEQAIRFQQQLIAKYQGVDQIPFTKLVNKLVLFAPFNLGKLSHADKKLAFLHIFIDYAPVLKPLLISYDQVYYPLQYSIFMFGTEYSGIGGFIKNHFPNLTRLTYRSVNDLVINHQYRNQFTEADAQTITNACIYFNNFNFAEPSLNLDTTNATTQASTHAVDPNHLFTLSQLELPNTKENQKYIARIQEIKMNLSNLCNSLHALNLSK